MQSSEQTSATSTSTGQIRVDLALLMRFLAILALGATVAWSIAAFLHPVAASLIAMILTWSFAQVTQIAGSRDSSVTGRQRLVASFAMWGLFSVTMGFSSATVYRLVGAENSALRQFEKARVPAERQLEQVLANAKSAQSAFVGWASHSEKMAKLEAEAGGTCPGRVQSQGRPGPISNWRRSDAVIAGQGSAEMTAAVIALETQLGAARNIAATDYSQVVGLGQKINGAIEAAESLVHGSALRAASDGLERQAMSVIAWPDGTKFACGDRARDEMIQAAQLALKALGKMSTLQRIQPAIDLSNKQDIATRGLLRSMNVSLKIVTLGVAGSFNDDPLMQEAVKANGILNRETLPMLLAALLEICLVLTSYIAARNIGKYNATPVDLDPRQGLSNWRACAKKRVGALGFLDRAAATAAAVAINILFTTDSPEKAAADAPSGSSRRVFQVSDHPVVELVDDPTVPSRELEWAKALQPFMVSLGGGDKDLVILPPAALAPHATTAIQALAYEGAAKMLGMDLPYALVARQDAVCRILSHFAHAEDLLYQIFQLAPSFAQALRIHLLTQPPLTVGQDSCRLQFPSG